MKYTMLFAALWLSGNVFAQTTYTFISTSGNWTDPLSWNPARIQLKPDDILQFNANAIVNGLPASESVGSLRILNGAQVKLSAGIPDTIQVGILSLAAPHFVMDPGTYLEFGGPSDIQFYLPSGCRGQIRGSIRFGAAAHRLIVTDSAGLVFGNGSSFTAGSGFTGNAFGTTGLNSVIFESGSRYISQDGGNPFGAMAPGTVVNFQNESWFYQQQAIGLSLGGRTYGNLQTEANINLSLFGSVNDVTIRNDFIINLGYFIFHPNTLHSGNFNIYGNIILNGNSNLDIGNNNMTGYVQLLGSGQLLGTGNGSGTCSFQNLRLNSPDFTTLRKTIVVKGFLDLQHGLFNTDSTHLISMGSSSSIVSPINAYGNSNEGWEESFVNGPIEINIAGIEEKVAPVGSGLLFAPVKIKKTNSNLISYRVEYFPHPYEDIYTVNSPTLDHVSHVEYWDISSNGPAADDDARLSLSWRPESFVGSTTMERNDLMIAHYTDFGFGIKWNAEGFAPTLSGNTNYGYITSDNEIASFSPFTLASKSISNALPLDEFDWKAVESGGIVKLTWTNKNSVKIDGFRVEKAEQGQNHQTILQIDNPRGINTTFSARDTLRRPSVCGYRLLAHYEAGWMRASPDVWISFRPENGLLIYPNPCRERLHVKFPNQSSNRRLELVNSSGQVIKILTLTENDSILNTSWLNNGKYYIRYRFLNKVVTKTFLKQ